MVSVRCSRCLSSSASSAAAAGSATEELGVNWEREIGNHFQPQARRIQRGGPYPGSDYFFKKTRIRVSNLASGVTSEQLHQLFASIDPAEKRSVGETQIRVGELDAEGACLVTLPKELYSRAMLLAGAELEGEPLVVEPCLDPEGQAVADSSAPAYGWEWSALGGEGHDNAAWVNGKGPRRALSSARYWDIVPDLLPHPPKLSVHLSCSWPQQVRRGASGGTAAAAFRGNTVSAEVLSSGSPALQWPGDGVADRATGGLTLIMSVLPPAGEGPEVAAALASYDDDEFELAGSVGSVWHGWVVANMDAASGGEVADAAATGEVIMPYQLSSSEEEPGPGAPLRPGARVAFALYAQQAAIGMHAATSVLPPTQRSAPCLTPAHVTLHGPCPA